MDLITSYRAIAAGHGHDDWSSLLTEQGASLNEALGPLGDWGTERAERLAAEAGSPAR